MAVVAPSFDDMLALGKAEAQARRPDLAFRDGDITEAQLHLAAAMADKNVEFAARLFRDTFIDGASGDALTALVDDHCNIQRKGATKATTYVSLSRPGPGTSSGTIPSGTRFATITSPDGTQAVFTLDSGIAVASGDGVSTFVTGTVTAVDSGPEGNVDGTKITKILDPLFDSTFVIAAAGSGAGGNLQESDEELRKRARNYFLTLRRGTLAAIEFGALLISSVRVAHASEDPNTFGVTLVVSDASGGSTLQMQADVEAEIENWRCAGILVSVFGGVQSIISLTVQLVVVSPGFDPATVTTAITNAVTAKINSRRGGESLYLDALTAAVIAVAPNDIQDIAFTAISIDGLPWAIAGNITPLNETVTFRAGTITVVGPDGV